MTTGQDVRSSLIAALAIAASATACTVSRGAGATGEVFQQGPDLVLVDRRTAAAQGERIIEYHEHGEVRMIAITAGDGTSYFLIPPVCASNADCDDTWSRVDWTPARF
jgi:hypothetical protein